MKKAELKEGYIIFRVDAVESKGMMSAAEQLEAAVKEAEVEYDINFLSGPTIKDDGSSGREMYFAYQGAVLRKKEAGKEEEGRAADKTADKPTSPDTPSSHKPIERGGSGRSK